MQDEPYRVPFVVSSDGRAVTITNASDAGVPWVSVLLVGSGIMTPLSPGRLDAGAAVRVRVSGSVQERGRLQLTWFRADGAGPFVWQSGV